MKNKILLTILLGVLLLANVYALDELGSYQKSKQLNLCQICSDATYITASVNYPNSTTAMVSKNLTSLGNGLFCIPFNNTNVIGVYHVTGISDGCSNTFATYFEITQTGYKLDNSQMILYLFIGIVLILLFILCIWGGIIIPYTNERNNNSEVISINWRKYLKIFCWFASYMLLLSIIFVVYNLIYAYSYWENLVIFFRYLYKLLFSIALPVFIGMLLMIVINYINDKKINNFIKKMGLPYNE